MSVYIKNNKIIAVVLFIIVVISLSIAYINNDKTKRVESYLKAQERTIQIQYNTIYTNYKIACENVYISLLKNKKLIGYFKGAKDASEKQKALLRDSMYELLKDRYKRIKKFGVRQLHFHLPNNESFLRMHKPGKFGDNLANIRYSVEYVNQTKKAIEGFEVGRVVHGFRFVFPVYDELKEHLGSVEISMSSEIFKDTIEGSFKSYVDFILTKDIVKRKLWEDQIGDYYEQSIFSDNYLKRKGRTNVSLVLDDNIKKRIEKNFSTNNVFSINIKRVTGQTGILTFLPIKNIKDNQKVAYFVAYQDDEIISRLDSDFYVVTGIVIFIGILLIIFFIKDTNYKYILEERIKRKTRSLEEKSELLLKKYEEQLHILNTLNESVFIYENEVFKECNIVAVDMLGYDNMNQLEKKEFLFFLDGVEKELVPNRCKSGESVTVEVHARKKCGEKFPALLKYHAYCTTEKCMMIISMVDLTVLKEKEKHLMQQSKLAQMGEMISMIAHQWRQPLAAISSTTNALILKSVMGKYDQDFFNGRLKNISDYSQHLSSTIDDFRNFFKTHKENREIELETIIDDSLKIIETSMENNNINIKKSYDCHIKVATFPNELRQVVLNLLKNAEDALLECEIDEKWIKVETYTDEDKKGIIISDNAGGIPEDIIEKIFEPYFSTKMNKNGTGLGLYMSKTIIEEHCEGKLIVSNDENGAVFRIEL